MKQPCRVLLLCAVFALIVSACGGPAAAGPATAMPNTTTPESASSTSVPATATPSGLITSLKEAEQGVIRIEAVGSFRDVGKGQVQGGWSGSGFFISADGYAVTNNHVVTGASLLRVYLFGETSYRNARVVGVSECSDLAVLKIDGEGFRYFEWYNQPIEALLPVVVAGFPLGTTKITLVSGQVSQPKSNGRTKWSSVESVIEHTAAALPGSSGAPLLSEDARVVGVHYRGNSAGQRFAISSVEALQVINRLKAGQNVDSIGINGTAFMATSNNRRFAGIWVVSIDPQSAANRAGLLPGDILLSMRNLSLAQDGTMTDYCDILRSFDTDAVTPIDVLRLDTGRVLSGELNGVKLDGDRPAATPTPTAGTAPTPAGLQPDPPSLALSDYQAAVSQQPEQLFETFDRGQRTEALWPQDDSAQSGAALRENVYQLTIKQPRTLRTAPWNKRQLGNNYNLELKTAFRTTGTQASVGIAFDLQTDGTNGVFFTLFNDKHWQVTTIVKGAVVATRSTARMAAPFMADGVGVNVLWVQRMPDVTHLWINSQHVGSIPAGPFKAGYGGVVVMARGELSGPATVLVDEFRVRE